MSGNRASLACSTCRQPACAHRIELRSNCTFLLCWDSASENKAPVSPQCKSVIRRSSPGDIEARPGYAAFTACTCQRLPTNQHTQANVREAGLERDQHLPVHRVWLVPSREHHPREPALVHTARHPHIRWISRPPYHCDYQQLGKGFSHHEVFVGALHHSVDAAFPPRRGDQGAQPCRLSEPHRHSIHWLLA